MSTSTAGAPHDGTALDRQDVEARIRALPKVLLHDHLDGGLRPATVVELAAAVGHELPETDPDALGAWFVRAASSGSLAEYLSTFEHTVAVMQTADALRRVAREAVVDLARDGVVHAELRYAPEQHLRAGLTLDEVVGAVREGIEAGVAEAAAEGRTIRAGALLCAMRHLDRGEEIAALTIAHRDAGVLGFDIAGPEDGFAPSRLAGAFRVLRDASMPVTVHAGEDAGLASVAEAVHVAGACRLGHGARVIDDVHATPDGGWRLGRLAHWIRDRRITLEMCPSSNVQTRAAASVAEHPATPLLRAGFAVTISTDNRLQSGTSLSRELALLVHEAGWTFADVVEATVTAARAAFVHHDERESLVHDVILPAAAGPDAGRHRA